MTVRLDVTTIHLEGRCDVDDAEPLLRHLQMLHEPAVDLHRCERLHTAVVQVLLAARAKVRGLPADPVLRRLLETHLERSP